MRHRVTIVERRRRENQGADGVGDWGGGVPLPRPTRGSAERRELPQRSPEWSPYYQRIFGIFEAHILSGRENSVTL